MDRWLVGVELQVDPTVDGGLHVLWLVLLLIHFFMSDIENGSHEDWIRNISERILGWLSSLAPAFGPGPDPEDPGSSPTSGSLHGMEPASPSACVSASHSLPLCVPHE